MLGSGSGSGKQDGISKGPFKLVYEMDVTFSVHLKIIVYKFMQQYSSNSNALQNKID